MKIEGVYLKQEEYLVTKDFTAVILYGKNTEELTTEDYLVDEGTILIDMNKPVNFANVANGMLMLAGPTNVSVVVKKHDYENCLKKI